MPNKKTTVAPMLQILESQQKDDIADEIFKIASEIKLYQSKYLDPSYLPHRDVIKPAPLPKKPTPKTSKYYGLTEEEHQALLKKNREWRAKRLAKMTPEERKEYSKKTCESAKKWANKNKKRIKQQKRYYHHQNKEVRNARKRARFAALTEEERRKVQDNVNLAVDKWKKRNPNFVTGYKRIIRLAKKLNDDQP